MRETAYFIWLFVFSALKNPYKFRIVILAYSPKQKDYYKPLQFWEYFDE